MFQDLQKILQTTCARPYVHFACFLSEEETLTGVVFDPRGFVFWQRVPQTQMHRLHLVLWQPDLLRQGLGKPDEVIANKDKLMTQMKLRAYGEA